MGNMTLQYNGLDFTMEQQDKLYIINAYDSKGKQAGRCRGFVEDCSFNGSTVKAMVIGCVGTQPEYRRSGMAWKTFEMLDAAIRDTGCLVSYLHPFSFPYYRTMGYERVSDHRVLEFDFDALEFLPRYTNLEKVYLEDSAEPLAQVYNAFSRERNVMLRRYDCGIIDEKKVVPTYMYGGPYMYAVKGCMCYLSRDEAGEPDGYMILRREMPLTGHYLINGTLHVEEMCFTTPEALRKLLSFLRVFEGEYDHVRITNCGMAPEVERVLRKYKYTKITVLPDVSGRVHDVAGVLKATVYPRHRGEFTVRVNDCAKSPFSKDLTEGTWNVVYENGTGTVTKVEDNAPCDLTLDMPAFSQLIHGFEAYGEITARAMEGVQLHHDCYDFFRAFPNRPAGSFELY